MSDNSQQPRVYDAVLGNQGSIPTNAAVLGGIEGIKHRLTFLKADTVRIAALYDALKYGQKGLELIMQIVETETGTVQWTAWDLLWERAGEKDKQKLQQYYPWRSEVGVDYMKLHHFLVAKKWFEANQETLKVILKAIGVGEQEGFYASDLKKIPGTDLHSINQLWVNYSEKHFGFSLQKSIWLDVGGKLDADWVIYEEFGDRIGWRVNNLWLRDIDLQFSLNAPKGHLPNICLAQVGQEGYLLKSHLNAIFSRIRDERE